MTNRTFTVSGAAPPPAWALRQRDLLARMNDAGAFFVRRYTREDGELVWRDEWPGMDGSDDGYESFFNFPLFYALGGSEEIHRLSRFEWDAVTRQFTRYGQVHNEFDGYYDWMHHGESNQYLYYFGLADPTVEKDRNRALRFAGMYNGEDPEADNYDPDRKLIRSPITGSRGPRYENSAEDWVTHRPVLANYPPPFEDLPGVSGPTADWNDDAIFDRILRLMNERMMRGDVPLNLTATSLLAHAFLYTGEPKYQQWVLDYTEAWMRRMEANGGIVPDNIGPDGKIGELMDDKWWGGYYGWRWPHGFNHLLEPILIAAANALLLTGDPAWLDFPRSQIDRIYELGHDESGRRVAPHRHGDSGWYDYRPMNPTCAIHLWALSQDAADRERVERLRGDEDWAAVAEHRGKGEYNHAAPWYAFIQGEFPDYPARILAWTHGELLRRLDAIRRDDGDPAEWDVHHWQDLNPVATEALTQLTLGCPMTLYHGGLLHSPLRYFDGAARRPGLPPDVSALVERVEGSGVTLRLVNGNPLMAREVTLQAGAFGEHRFTQCRTLSVTASASTHYAGNTPQSSDSEDEMDARHLTLQLEPGAAAYLRLGLRRYAGTPSYARPWDVPDGGTGRGGDGEQPRA